jgi:hypothetical protein
VRRFKRVEIVTTLNTQTFTVQLAGGAKIKDARNRIATIFATDGTMF